MGAPTSPLLVNAILRGFDGKLKRILQGKDSNITITRFGDDITISSPSSLPEETLSIASQVASDFGYRLNRDKTEFRERGGSTEPIKISGIVVGNGRLLWPDRKLKKYEMLLIRVFEDVDYNLEEISSSTVSKIRSTLGLTRMIYKNNGSQREDELADLPKRLAKCIEQILEKTPNYFIPQARSILLRRRDSSAEWWQTEEARDLLEEEIQYWRAFET